MSFIELFDFIIYQHLNKRTNILPLAISKIAHLCHQFNLVCHVLKTLFFNPNSPKMRLFLKKNSKFSRAGGSAPISPCLRRLGALFLATRLFETRFVCNRSYCLHFAVNVWQIEWSLEPEPERSRSRILHFFAGAGAEPEWQYLKKIRSRSLTL